MMTPEQMEAEMAYATPNSPNDTDAIYSAALAYSTYAGLGTRDILEIIPVMAADLEALADEYGVF